MNRYSGQEAPGQGADSMAVPGECPDAGGAALLIIKAGPLTTVQDLGRPGRQKHGVSPGGAMDRLSLRTANRLVGNPEGAAALEMTMTGITARLEGGARIALCGAGLQATLDGVPVPLWRPVVARSGSLLECGALRQGCRTYLALEGGIAAPQLLGSRSTYVTAAIGGWQGRGLQAGDRLPLGRPFRLAGDPPPAPDIPGPEAGNRSCWRAYPFWLEGAWIGSTAIIRVAPGPEFGQFPPQARRRFFGEAFRLSPDSNRMGVRLTGSPIDPPAGAGEMLSAAVAAGAVQVPSSGEPIVLMAEHQTTGGYPRIGQVASGDLSVLAQCRPGDQVRFELITHEEAESLYLDMEQRMGLQAAGIRCKLAQM